MKQGTSIHLLEAPTDVYGMLHGVLACTMNLEHFDPVSEQGETLPLAKPIVGRMLLTDADVETRFSKLRNSRIGLWAARIAIVGSIFGSAVAFEATPAQASADVQVHGTDGEGVWLHDGGPGLHTSLKVVMPENASFTAECYNVSDAVNGDPAWLHGTYHSPDGDVQGDVTDAYTSTKWQTFGQLESQGILRCSTEQSQNQANDVNNIQPAEKVKPFIEFNRGVAA